jgi:uncharacterized membrane protein
MEYPIFNAGVLIRPFLEYLSSIIDVAVAIVIAISVTRGFIMYLKILHKSPLEQTKEEQGIKHYVGNGLILALDLMIGSDIIKTIFIPTVQDLLVLALIVAIRIIFSRSLSKEMRLLSENK